MSTHNENSEWQLLMRQAMAGACACAAVTDDTRMANAIELTIRHDMQLAGVEPIVIISKTETMEPERRAALRASAAKHYETSSDRVFCTGTGAAFQAEWAPQLIAALQTARNSPGEVRKAQIGHLDTLLRDLRDILDEARSLLAARDAGEMQQANQATLFLNYFDDAVKRLRASYKKTLGNSLDAHFKEASKKLEDSLIKNHQGWLNKIKSLPNTVGEDQQHLREDIEKSWENRPGLCDDLHAAVMAKVTFKALGGPETSLVPLTVETSPQLRLGYTDADGEVSAWSGGGDSSRQALRYLLNDDRSVQLENKQLITAVKELPALALEFCRYM